MDTAIIAARSLNGIIGNGSSIPWRVKGEQAMFKKITMGGILIMGRKTFDAIGRPLPGRLTIIITRNLDYTGNSVWSVIHWKLPCAVPPRLIDPFLLLVGVIFIDSRYRW